MSPYKVVSLSEKIPLFFLFFFVPSPDLLDVCGSQEIEGMQAYFSNRIRPGHF
jgi:hypothetical protein